MDYRVWLGIIATLLAIVGYIPYFRDIFKGRTKPHAFTWLVWGLLTAIAFAAQLAEGGGAGAWVTGFTALISFIIFGLALTKGERRFVAFDWYCLAGAAVALLLWWLTESPLWSVVLVTVIDALAFLPTFRKSYHRPYEETVSTYVLSGLKFLIAIFALQAYTPATWLYPASLVLMNWLFVAMVLWRR